MRARELAEKIQRLTKEPISGLPEEMEREELNQIESLLRAHDDEVIERCAQMADTMASHDNHLHIYSIAEVIQRRIRRLKSGTGEA